MKAVLIMLAFTVGAIMRDVVPLVKKGWFKESVFYLALLLAGDALVVITLQLVSLPSPMVLLRLIYSPLLSWFAP